MSQKVEEHKAFIIETVTNKIREKIVDREGELCAEFARQFLGTVSLDDLLERSTDDLYGAIVNFWALMKQRKTHETKIRIYNPDYERDGWQTTHTVIEIICDDRSFLVDSIRMVVTRMELALHLIIHMGGIWLKRDKQCNISAILPKRSEIEQNVLVEAPILLEIDRQTDPEVLTQLRENLMLVLEENRAVVEDWDEMRAKVRELVTELDSPPSQLDVNEVTETKAFLNWIEDHHFTFLGIRDYTLIHKSGDIILQPLPKTGYGILRDSLSKPSSQQVSLMTPEVRELMLSSRILVISKTDQKANVHRDAYTDYISVKRFDKEGHVIGERRILGLYTSAAYNTSPKYIPFLRHKVALILQNSMLSPRSHAGRVLLNILETLPRDDLIQANEDELLQISMGIFQMQERRRIRMFARMDVYHRFISCLVYVPRDRYNTELREAIQEVLSENLNSENITFSTLFTESVLARIHYMIRLDTSLKQAFDFKDIEQKIIEVGRSWSDDLQNLLHEAYGEERANALFSKYKNAFPAVYMTNFSSRTALLDIKHIEQLSEQAPLGMNFYRPLDEFSNSFRLKIYQHDVTIPLSDVLPIIEQLGLRAISERPYILKFENDKITWVNEFSLQLKHPGEFPHDDMKELFQNAFLKVWFGEAENDGFNQLVLAAGLDWRQVTMLRAYAKYFKQIGLTFSQEYIEAALNNNPSIARKLVHLFEQRFDPDLHDHRDQRYHALTEEILADLDEVANLDEDKIIRQYIHTILATIRTNYYQYHETESPKNYLSLKIRSKLVPNLPRPHPLYEIFVYSPKFEAVHLRASKVARGGLRWSDRKEDFRTEILGLMKAQQVKNAVIVPNGAKGGFVVKQATVNLSREELLAEGISCYKRFIRGMLDITDNYEEGLIVKPKLVVCYDDDDPYLVVAADKGTATFSDIANEISLSYGFWLGDAFASGGSIGYDHKKMGITARGAWESVKRHFYYLNLDIETNSFTVVGIGDMAGDVFGNGMLMSKQIKLLAAFNHMHIFVDPKPDLAVSFQERERLFNLPRSTWADYDKKLISQGGGVFNRSTKSIHVSEEMQQLFGIRQSTIEPNELIKMILRAKVDLLWSGGIGTFVKAQQESHQEVGDRTNDGIRINAKQLRCKVVAEGGNLGLTQLARVEYALNGGLIYTDFIDNSAGVSCSDKEVNIKILLDQSVAQGDLTFKQRNELLSEMTEEVASIVLNENYLQTRAISVSAAQAFRAVDLHSRYISELERQGKLDRALEFLPANKLLMERKLAHKGLTAPEMAVLYCYSKIILKEAILASHVPEDEHLVQFLITAFPKPLQERFATQMQQHPLKREIIATRVSNTLVNEMGSGFVYRLQDETGAPISAIVCAYMSVRSILSMDKIWREIDVLDKQKKIDAKTQSEIMMTYVRLLRRLSRWFLRSKRTCLDIKATVSRYQQSISDLQLALPHVLGEEYREQYMLHLQEYLDKGIPQHLAEELTTTRGLFASMDIIEIAFNLKLDVAAAAAAYFGVGEFLEIAWIRHQIIIHATESPWEALAREALRDDLDMQQRLLTASILNHTCDTQQNFEEALHAWSENHPLLIERWKNILSHLRSSSTLNYTMFFVALRELFDLTQTTLQSTNKPKLFEGLM